MIKCLKVFIWRAFSPTEIYQFQTSLFLSFMINDQMIIWSLINDHLVRLMMKNLKYKIILVGFLYNHCATRLKIMFYVRGGWYAKFFIINLTKWSWKREKRPIPVTYLPFEQTLIRSNILVLINTSIGLYFSRVDDES